MSTVKAKWTLGNYENADISVALDTTTASSVGEAAQRLKSTAPQG